LRLAQLGVWRCELLLLMPDHLHLLASFAGNQEMHQVVARWKRWMAWRENLIFQAGFFDHRLRSVASSCEKWTYIYSNPVRGGLITDPKDWPYVWTAAAFETSERSACKADPT
jgi:putative transposase